MFIFNTRRSASIHPSDNSINHATANTCSQSLGYVNRLSDGAIEASDDNRDSTVFDNK
ncbi:MAG: hypothetical protein LBH80_02895 [Prevotellaceae bacterium]|nr:hypothetical protein [Prevotellaceae bacterium]